MDALLRDYDALEFLKADGSADLTPCPERNTRVLQALGVRKDGTRQSIAEMEIFPAEYFCPMDLYRRELRVTPKTYSIHRYAESWKPKPSAALVSGSKVRRASLSCNFSSAAFRAG